jgi:hypothetical protein
LRNPSSMWAWSSGRNGATCWRTYTSNKRGAIAMACPATPGARQPPPRATHASLPR